MSAARKYWLNPLSSISTPLERAARFQRLSSSAGSFDNFGILTHPRQGRGGARNRGSSLQVSREQRTGRCDAVYAEHQCSGDVAKGGSRYGVAKTFLLRADRAV